MQDYPHGFLEGAVQLSHRPPCVSGKHPETPGKPKTLGKCGTSRNTRETRKGRKTTQDDPETHAHLENQEKPRTHRKTKKSQKATKTRIPMHLRVLQVFRVFLVLQDPIVLRLLLVVWFLASWCSCLSGFSRFFPMSRLLPTSTVYARRPPNGLCGDLDRRPCGCEVRWLVYKTLVWPPHRNLEVPLATKGYSTALL